MKTAKEIALVSIYTALLIGGQLVLSPISGIEIVTVLLLAFCYYFGVKLGLMVANAFSVLRCLVFGFFPTVIILYLIYYNLFAVIFGLTGIRFKGKLNLKNHAVLLITAMLMTALFTLLDDVITPLYFGFSRGTAKAYWVTSLAALVPQLICTAVTVSALAPVLIRIFSGTKFFENKSKIK